MPNGGSLFFAFDIKKQCLGSSSLLRYLLNQFVGGWILIYLVKEMNNANWRCYLVLRQKVALSFFFGLSLIAARQDLQDAKYTTWTDGTMRHAERDFGT